MLPEDGYLQGVKDLLHEHGALLAFDEVKTGATLAYGGAVEAFGVTPDLLCLAKSVGGGLPCGAIGGTDEVMGWIAEGKIDQVGTFNGNPLTMAAMHATLTEILVPDAYTEFSRLGEILREGCDGVIERNGLPATPPCWPPAARSPTGRERVRNYRDYLEVSDELAYVNWLVQFNRGVFMAPWGKSRELDAVGAAQRGRRPPLHRQLRVSRKGADRMKAVVFEEHGGTGCAELHRHPRAGARRPTRC